ncbi:MAG: hypothetical protein M3N48_07120, partial [Verrucomicrobiota bacterium]|nr:hypothetical protein [Verrucomicrobiota bacterium]
MKNLLKFALPLIFATQMIVRAGRVEIRSSAPGSASIHLIEGAAVPADSAPPSNGLTSRALASADFDEDGVPDLVTGYADPAGGGMVLIRRGNVDAIYPNGPEARLRRERGQFTTAAFLAGTKSFPVPEPADFVGVGDFDA